GSRADRAPPPFPTRRSSDLATRAAARGQPSVRRIELAGRVGADPRRAAGRVDRPAAGRDAGAAAGRDSGVVIRERSAIDQQAERVELAAIGAGVHPAEARIEDRLTGAAAAVEEPGE